MKFSSGCSVTSHVEAIFFKNYGYYQESTPTVSRYILCHKNGFYISPSVQSCDSSGYIQDEGSKFYRLIS